MTTMLARPVAIVFAIALTVAAGGGQAVAQEAGDPRRGAKIYERCVACHSLRRNRTGPRHCGLIGRRAGGLPDFTYSKAMRKSGLIWSPETLDEFLVAPLAAMPGTRMGYAGVKDPRERADLIAYLLSATMDSELCR